MRFGQNSKPLLSVGYQKQPTDENHWKHPDLYGFFLQRHLFFLLQKVELDKFDDERHLATQHPEHLLMRLEIDQWKYCHDRFQHKHSPRANNKMANVHT